MIFARKLEAYLPLELYLVKSYIRLKKSEARKMRNIVGFRCLGEFRISLILKYILYFLYILSVKFERSEYPSLRSSNVADEFRHFDGSD